MRNKSDERVLCSSKTPIGCQKFQIFDAIPVQRPVKEKFRKISNVPKFLPWNVRGSHEGQILIPS